MSRNIADINTSQNLERLLTNISELENKNKDIIRSNHRIKKEIEHVKGENESLSEIIHGIDAIIYINEGLPGRNYMMIWTNGKEKDVIGYARMEIMEKGILNYFSKTLAAGHTDIIMDSWDFFDEHGKEPYSGVYKRLHKDGRWLWIYGIGHIYKRKPDGSPERYIGIAIDITERIVEDKDLKEMFNENLKLKHRIKISSLSKSERKVLELIGLGLTNHVIAERLNVSQHTIDTHRKHLLKKMELKNTAELVRFATECGII